MTTKVSVSETHKIGIFPNGLVDGFGQKFEIWLTFLFMQNTPKKKFGHVLLTKQAFDNINMDFEKEYEK